MIKKLIIENFRSIEFIEVNLSSLNAFIGPNNAGKSNIMKALNLILGEFYPTVRSCDNKDFHNYQEGVPIKIEVRFDLPIAWSTGNFACDIHGFQLIFNGRDCEYFAIDDSGEIILYPNKREVRVSTEMRERVALMYLGLDRQAAQQVKPTQWTLYGKLLRHIEKQIKDENRLNFKEGIKNTYTSNIYPNLLEMENILKNHVKSQTGLDLLLHLSIIDPIETIKNVRPYFKDESSLLEFDAEDMGAGTQSALAVAIARAYSEIVKHPPVIAIEEPELYMHPHGCRHFFKLLKELSANGVQVIYTTHERSFVDISNFKSIHLVRKEEGQTQVYSGIDKTISSDEEIKLASKFDDNINEVLFANAVILVEGFNDRIGCKLALESLGFELDKHSISVTDCGSNSAIKPVSELLDQFNIPTCALIDEDPSDPNTAKIIQDLRTILDNENVLLQSPDLEGMFGLSKKLDKAEALKFFPTWFSQNSPPQVYTRLKNRIDEILQSI